MLVGHRDMIGYHKQAMPPDDSSKNISPTPSVDIQRSTGHGLNLQKQSSRMVMKADFTQPDRKYHELSTHELEECAHRRCLLHIDEMSRNCLMENLRILDGWHARTLPRLAALAKEHGCPVRPGSTHESLMTDMINYIFGNPEEKAAVAAFFELTGTTSVDAAKTGTTSAHSAHRSDDTFVAEVWRILEAKDDREVLGFKCAEPLTLQEAMSRYRQLTLQLHSDKRTETGIAKAGGFQVCELAWTRLTHARIWADRTLKKKTTTQTAPFYQSRSAASLHPSDISVARQPKLEVGFPRATAISQEQETPHLCSCGKCYDYCQYYTKALDCWVPCCFSWFIGLHMCPHIIEAELTLEPKCRLQNDGKTVWLGLFVTAMKLKNDDLGDSVNGTYDLHQWDFHCTIGVFRLTKKATVHSRLTPVELWDQKMLQIGVSHRKCNCCIKRVLDEEEVDWYKQWKICYGGDALTSARNTMMQCFPFNHHGPPVEVMRTFQAWRPGLFLHLSAYNKKRDNNSLTTSLCTSATDRFAAAVTDDC